MGVNDARTREERCHRSVVVSVDHTTRIFGVIVASLSAITTIVFLSAFPVWSAIVVAVDILIIWAITVHGAEMKKR